MSAFGKSLPFPVLHEQELCNPRRINVFGVKINIGFVLKSLRLARRVESHTHSFTNAYLVILKAKSMELQIVFGFRHAREPKIFLPRFFLTQIKLVRLQRENRLRGDCHRAIQHHSQVGGMFQNATNFKIFRHQFEVAVIFGHGKCRDQQQKRKQSGKCHKLSCLLETFF